MTISIIDPHYDKVEYNRIVSHPLQSWEWGEARNRMGIEVLKIGEFDNQKLTKAYQLTLHKIPKTPFRIGYLPRSPFPSKQALEFLSDYGKKHKIIFFKIESDVKKTDLNNKTIEQFSNLTLSSHPLFPRWTIHLDLTRSEEELLENMKPKTRYNIRLAQKKGVVVREVSTDEGFSIFSNLYFDTCKRQKYFGHTKEYHRLVWESLKNTIAHILIAFYNNEPVAAYELFYFNHTLYYPYGGTSLIHRNTMAANLLMWETIRLGKQWGATNFDMWGSAGPDSGENHAWSGFTRFKEGYGGRYTEMVGSYDLVVSPLLYRLYGLAEVLRKQLLRLRS